MTSLVSRFLCAHLHVAQFNDGIRVELVAVRLETLKYIELFNATVIKEPILMNVCS
jgi:hypothetical protein